MKIRNDGILELNTACEALVKTNMLTFKHMYACNRTIAYLKQYVTAIRKSIEPSEKYQEYIGMLREIINSLAEKDKMGQLILNSENQPTFTTEEIKKEAVNKISELQNKYADIISYEKDKINNYDKILSEEVELDIYTLKNESDMSNIDLMDIVKTRYMYNIPLNNAIEKKVPVEDILSLYLASKNERQIKDLAIKKHILANMISIEPVFNNILNDPNYTDYYFIYENTLRMIREKHAVKDIFGDPMIIQNKENANVSEYIIQDNVLFNKEMDAFKEKNQKIKENFEDFRKKEFEVKVSLFSKEHVDILEKMENVNQMLYLTINMFLDDAL